jgi:hypothetical protein
MATITTGLSDPAVSTGTGATITGGVVQDYQERQHIKLKVETLDANTTETEWDFLPDSAPVGGAARFQIKVGNNGPDDTPLALSGTTEELRIWFPSRHAIQVRYRQLGAADEGWSGWYTVTTNSRNSFDKYLQLSGQQSTEQVVTVPQD